MSDTTTINADGTVVITTGSLGLRGARGLSAYEVAVAEGFVGTEAEWLESLEGTSGGEFGGTASDIPTDEASPRDVQTVLNDHETRIDDLEASPPGGVSDHGALTGLSDDDHSQYHNDARGDARYWPLSTDLATQAELDAHSTDTTSVHGIADTSALETTSGAQAKADAKVAQTITNGVTTSAPSQDVVFDALALKADQSALDAHLNDTADAHDASAISTSGATPSNVQTVLDEHAAHIVDAVGAHHASAITTDPVGVLVGTTVDAQLTELEGLVVPTGAIDRLSTAMPVMLDDFISYASTNSTGSPTYDYNGSVGQLGWRVLSRFRIIVDATGGNWTASYGGVTTANIAATATAATVQSALEALTTIDAGDVFVTGGPGNAGGTTPYYLEWIGRKLRELPSTVTVANVSLSGGASTVVAHTGVRQPLALTTTANTPGVCSLLVNSTANLHYAAISLGESMEGAPVFANDWRIKLSNANNGTDDFTCYFGLASFNYLAEPLNGYYFKLTNASTNWRAVIADNGTRAEVDTGVAHSSTAARFRIEGDGGGNVNFYINGTIVSNMPLTDATSSAGSLPSTGNKYGPLAQIIKTVGSAGFRSLQIDQFGLYFEVAR